MTVLGFLLPRPGPLEPGMDDAMSNRDLSFLVGGEGSCWTKAWPEENRRASSPRNRLEIIMMNYFGEHNTVGIVG